MGDFKAFATAAHVGRGLPLLNQSLIMAMIQSSGFSLVPVMMASSVPGDVPSSNPIVYHFDRASHTALSTSARSLMLRCPACENKQTISRQDNIMIVQIYSILYRYQFCDANLNFLPVDELVLAAGKGAATTVNKQGALYKIHTNISKMWSYQVVQAITCGALSSYSRQRQGVWYRSKGHIQQQ